MLRSLLMLFVYTSFLGLSFNAPFVATLGYVWVDTFQPQYSATIVLNLIPVAMVMGAAAFGTYLLTDRRSAPPLSLETILQVVFAVWVTLTSMWAAVPDQAWGKWDWAFKTIIFAAFIPYVIRSRVQIEAFAQVYLFSLAANIIPFGAKTMISGGGYGVNLGLQSGNTGMSESGLLATVCLMSVPLTLYLSKHQQLLPRLKILPLAYWGLAVLAIVTAIGTYERSALLGLIVMYIYVWVGSRQKFVIGLAGVVGACLLMFATSSAWNARVSTITTYESENSAYNRVLVWKWTLGYVSEHPLGGGFMSYLIDHIETSGGGYDAGSTMFGVAFHSIYFEVLGEHGYPGLVLFLMIAGLAFVRLRAISRWARTDPELEWIGALSHALQSGLAVFMTTGAFLGMAFQPMFWYFIAMSIALNAYRFRVERGQPVAVSGWRALATQQNAEPLLPAQPSGWRQARVASQAVTITVPRR
jgi:probable O-glycosylation ligase (exosortase A-associated)